MTDRDQALRAMIDRYGDMIFRLAITRVRNRSDAEDICQEVFLRWYTQKAPFESEEHEKAWLIRVTLNCTNTLLTSSWFKRTVPLPETLGIKERSESAVWSAVMSLSKTDRTLIHLYYYEEYSTAEIAELTQTTEGTVRSRLSRARKRLEEILKGEFTL